MHPTSLANLKPPWKHGHVAISPGRPRGCGSVVSFLKRRLRDAPLNVKGNYETLADEIAAILIKQAKKGKFQFMNLLIDKAENRQVDIAELKAEVERVYLIVRKHVKDDEIMQAIAQDLNRFEDEDE